MNRPVISAEWEAWFECWLVFTVPEVLDRPGAFEALLGVIDNEINRRDQLIGAVDRAANEVLIARVAELEKKLLEEVVVMDDDVMDGVPGAIPVSGECVERLEVWAMTHPKGLEDPEYLPGLVVIVAEESERRLRAVCWKWLRKIGQPCKQ